MWKSHSNVACPGSGIRQWQSTAWHLTAFCHALMQDEPARKDRKFILSSVNGRASWATSPKDGIQVLFQTMSSKSCICHQPSYCLLLWQLSPAKTCLPDSFIAKQSHEEKPESKRPSMTLDVNSQAGSSLLQAACKELFDLTDSGPLTESTGLQEQQVASQSAQWASMCLHICTQGRW